MQIVLIRTKYLKIKAKSWKELFNVIDSKSWKEPFTVMDSKSRKQLFNVVDVNCPKNNS